MKQYDSYKDSGVQWIGEIPSHWECVSISHLSSSRSGGTPDRQKKEYWDNGTIPWMSSGEVNKGFVYDTEESITELASLNSSAKILPKNSVMIALNGQGKTKGMAAVLKIEAACNQSLCAFSCDERLHYMFLYYNFKSMYKYLRSQAGDETREGLAASFVKKQKISLPPFSEQERIVGYLDKKCAEIDKAIATQQKRIELLQELRQNIITQAVTRGINPDAPLKDSGVEWIGMVPEHWVLCRLKNCGSICSGDGITNEEVKDSGTYEVYGGNGLMGYAEKYNIDTDKIIIGRVGALCGNIHISKGKRFISDNSLIFTSNKRTLIDYLAFYMISANLNQLNTSSAQPLITGTKVMNVRMPLPPLSEQQAIVTHIKSETAKLDKQVAKANRQISLLQELKQSIITEVVTGKRKVC